MEEIFLRTHISEKGKVHPVVNWTRRQTHANNDHLTHFQTAFGKNKQHGSELVHRH